MATKLGTVKSKSVTRETLDDYRGRKIIVKLDANGRLIRFKEKGRRMWHTATVRQLYWVAVDNTSQELRKLAKQKRLERAALRKAGKA